MKSIREFFADLFEFSKPHSAATKFLNIMAVFTISILWLIFVLFVLVVCMGLGKKDAIELIQATITINFASSVPALQVLMGSVLFNFFLACGLAPFWEEACFRWGPITLAQALGHIAHDAKILWSLVAVFSITSAIIFGLCHGSALNIVIQGVSGMLFCWLYLKNNNSYWSVVIAHALWNFIIIFGLPFIMMS